MSKSPKTPKTPKSGRKDKKVETQTKIKYGIFVINFDKTLWPIAQVFGQKLQEYERRAILGFSREDVVKEILIQQEKVKNVKETKALTSTGKKDKKDEKDGKGKKDKKDKKDKKGKDSAREPEVPKEENSKKEVKLPEMDKEVKPIDLKMFVLDEKTLGLFSSKVRERIDKLVKKSEAVSRSIKSREDFDFLKYWEERGDLIPKKGDDKKGKGKEGDKKGKKDTKVTRARGGAEKPKGKKEGGKDGQKGKKKEDKGKAQADDTGCQIKEVKRVKLDEKIWSKIQPSVFDDPMKFKVCY